MFLFAPARVEDWCAEAEICLYALEAIKTDCTAMTMLVHTMFTHAGVPHQAMRGYARHRTSRYSVVPHYWIELEQGRFVVDLRLRMWLGDTDDIPHGIFDKSDWPLIEYHGAPTELPLLEADELDAVSDGLHGKMDLPPWPHAAQPPGA